MMTPSHAVRSIQAALVRKGVWAERSVSLEEVQRLVEELQIVAGPCPLIRIGSEADGGYLIPDDLDDIGACISPGVSTEVGFDLDLAQRGIAIHMADASVAGPPVPHENFHFTRKFLDTFNSETTITLDDFIRDVAPGRDLILEMDIEGAEWRVFNSLSLDALRRFRIMAIEFHDLVSMFSRFGFREISGVFRKILETHAVVHIHPNNVTGPVAVDGISVPSLMEFTFYRRDRGNFSPAVPVIPHPLDAPCCIELPDYPLPRCWYRSA